MEIALCCFFSGFLGASLAECVDDMLTVFRSFYSIVRVLNVWSLHHWRQFTFFLGSETLKLKSILFNQPIDLAEIVRSMFDKSVDRKMIGIKKTKQRSKFRLKHFEWR